MTIFRLLPNGVRRRLPDGGVRALGADGLRYADIGGETGVGVGSGGHPTAWVPLDGESLLAFALTASLDSAGVLGRTALSISLAGQLAAAVNLQGGAALGFGSFARLTAFAPVSGATAVTVEVVGRLAAVVGLAGAAMARMTVQGRLGAPAGVRGAASVGVALVGVLSVSSAARWRDVWRDVYATRQALLDAIDANNRELAKNAGDAAGAVAEALVVTNAEVTELDGRITAEASRITALTTRVTNVETVNTGQATAISGLQSTVTSHGTTITAHSSQITGLSASITTLDGEVTVIANATEALSVEVSSIGNIAKATWGVYLDVNGYVSGVQSTNNGLRSEFKIRADVFKLINSASSGLESQNGWIRAFNGASQVIMGNGFGASGNLMFYAGPNVGVAAASKSNATIWFDQSGNAYFGGTLSAGIWKNAAQSTQLGIGANVSTGTFASMGNQRTVVCSFSLEHSGDRVGNNAGTSPLGVTVNLYRNGSLVQSFPISGNYTGVYDAEVNRTSYTCNFGGSFTHTDNTGGTSCEYSLTLSSKVGTWPRTDFNTTSSGPAQRLSVISTEEP